MTTLKEKLGLQLQLGIPLAPFTTFKIGGPARYFVVAQSVEELMRALGAAVECKVPYFILAGGSNVLISDEGLNGLVILNAIKGFQSELRGGQALVTAGAGENWDELVARCVYENWAGIECLSGIPGTVGAAPVQNIGAYGQSVEAVIRSVEAIDSISGALTTFDKSQCEFGYRTSIFKKTCGRYSITRVTFALTPGGVPLLAYHDLQEYFGKDDANASPRMARILVPKDKNPSLAEVRRAVIEIRARKGYVIMPEYESYKTAGSFFMNPVMTPAQFQNIRSVIQGCPEPWYWPLPNSQVKVSAACLLQNAGFPKGYRQGEVGISPKHALSIVNFANASAREIVALAQEIKTTVQEKFGIVLEEEVQLVGF